MNPTISNIDSTESLKFRLSGVNVSIANGLRRIILSEIPTVVFRTSPHNENKLNIITNTSRFNNELIKQRFSCIPIHITDTTFPIDDYVVEAELINNTNTIIYLTTNDLKVKNIKTDTYLSQKETNKIFPPDNLTGDYIDIVRLRPRISDKIPGEAFTMVAKLDIGTAKQDGAFNCVSNCSYSATVDAIKANEAWKKEEQKISGNDIDIDMVKQDWMLLEAKRHTIPESFDFEIETVGPFENKDIVIKAGTIMLDKISGFISKLQSEEDLIEISVNTMPNCFDIIMNGEGYTLGKVIEFIIYQNYFVNDKSVTYCGFRKPHPHIDTSILRVAFKEPKNKSEIVAMFASVANDASEIYKKIISEF